MSIGGSHSHDATDAAITAANNRIDGLTKRADDGLNLISKLEERVAKLESAQSTVPPVEPPDDEPPVETPPVEPPVEPPTSTANILGVNFTTRPQSGPAWDALVKASKGSLAVSLTSTDGANQGNLLAAAFVAAATGDTDLREKVYEAATNALAGPTSRTLEMARNLAPIAIALSAIGDHSQDQTLLAARDAKVQEQGSVIDCHKHRPNNWGTCSGLARIAVDLHVRDFIDLADAVKVYRGWLGDRSQYAGFGYGDTSWQANEDAPVGINPKGAVKGSVNVDGILPDDQRRAAAFPNYACENYVWQALGEAMATGILLLYNSYPEALNWSDRAIDRAYQSLIAHGCKATGDDGWQAAAARLFLGLPVESDGDRPGKSFGWADFLYS